MATAIATFTAVDDHAEVAALLKKLEPLRARLEAFQRESNALHLLTSPYAVYDGPTHATDEDGWRARRRQPELTREIGDAQIALAGLDRELTAARETEKARRVAARLPRKRDVIRRIARQGDVLAKLFDELATSEDEDERDCGPLPERRSWQDLFGPATATLTPRWSHWIENMRTLGLLDE